MLHKTAADLLKRTKDKQKTAKLKLMKQWEEEATLRNKRVCTLLIIKVCIFQKKVKLRENYYLEGLSNEIDFKKVNKKGEILALKGHGNEPNFPSFLHKSLWPRSFTLHFDFGFEFAEIFVFEKRLPESGSRQDCL
jgi:hypothetical protein